MLSCEVRRQFLEAFSAERIERMGEIRQSYTDVMKKKNLFKISDRVSLKRNENDVRDFSQQRFSRGPLMRFDNAESRRLTKHLKSPTAQLDG